MQSVINTFLMCVVLVRKMWAWIIQHHSGFRRTQIRAKHHQRNFSYRVGSQGHSPPTASTELCLAIRTQVPTTICEFGLVADATGWCIVPMNSRARCRRGLPDHRLPVAGQLLLDASGIKWNRLSAEAGFILENRPHCESYSEWQICDKELGQVHGFCVKCASLRPCRHMLFCSC